MLYYVLICNLAHAQLYASSCVCSTILLYEQLLSLDMIGTSMYGGNVGLTCLLCMLQFVLIVMNRS